MWFRPGQNADTDRFRVSSLKNRMRRFRSPVKNSLDLIGDASKSDDSNAAASDDTTVDNDNENSIDNNRNTNLVQRSPSGKKLHKIEKEKTLLTDRKFKNSRVLKSSSKGKISDLDKRSSDPGSTKRSGSNRKISAPPCLDPNKLATVAAETKKHVRSHSNLNLNALLRYKLSSKKLSTADFDRLRRKSISDTSENKKLKKAKSTESECTDDDRNSANQYKDVQSSFDLDEEDVFLRVPKDTPEVVVSKKSPSLSARVAARFSDGANSKAKKAKQKKRRNSRGAILSAQNSLGNLPHDILFYFKINFSIYITKI